MRYDTIIRNGRWFDGTGARSAVRTIGIWGVGPVARSVNRLGGNFRWHGRPFMAIEKAVHRLTGELADWYRLDAGHLRIGDRADLVVIDPNRLDSSLDAYAEEGVEQYGGLSRMVNRNDDTVNAVFAGGRAVFLNGEATELVGTRRTGRFLRAAHKAPAPAVVEVELSSVS